jgi:hypothetical protein
MACKFSWSNANTIPGHCIHTYVSTSKRSTEKWMVPYGHNVANNRLPRELHVHQLGLTTRLVFRGPYSQLTWRWTEPAVLKVITHSCSSGLAGAHSLSSCLPPGLHTPALPLLSHLVHMASLSLVPRFTYPCSLYMPALSSHPLVCMCLPSRLLWFVCTGVQGHV